MTRPGARSLHYDQLGDGPVPVLMLHGLGADCRQPAALLTGPLLEAGRYLMPDLRGHGQTSLPCGPAELTFRQLADDVEQLLRQLHLDTPIVLAGISMGAAVACELLARGQVQARGIILIRPAWKWEPAPPNLDVFPVIARLLETAAADLAKALLAAAPEFAAIRNVSPAAAGALLAQFDAPAARERAQRLRALPAGAPARPGQVPAGIPATVISSGLDPVHPVPLAAAVAADMQVPVREISPRYEAPGAHAEQAAHAIGQILRQT